MLELHIKCTGYNLKVPKYNTLENNLSLVLEVVCRCILFSVLIMHLDTGEALVTKEIFEKYLAVHYKA